MVQDIKRLYLTIQRVLRATLIFRMPIRAKALLPTIIFAIGLAQWGASQLFSALTFEYVSRRLVVSRIQLANEVYRITIVID